MKTSKAIRCIEKRGILLVFPINNKPEPRSLWSEFFPRTPMRWEWDSDGDNRVADLWHLREELSRCRKVIYTKWYKGRATFFSREVFRYCYSQLAQPNAIGRDASRVFEILEHESPLSTKALKKLCKLEGRFEEKNYNRALKELWEKLLIVGFGEVDDGAFPSLNIGATNALFEELTRPSSKKLELTKVLGEKNPFYLEFEKLQKTAKPLTPKATTKTIAQKKIIYGKDLIR